MLTQKEEKLVRRYYVLSRIALPSLFMALAVPSVWLALMIFDEKALYARSSSSEAAYLCLGITCILLAVYCFSMITLELGTRKLEWLKIEDALGTSLGKGTDSFRPADRRRRVQAAADRLGGKLPGMTVPFSLIMILPLAIMGGVYALKFQRSVAERNQRIQTVRSAEQKLEQAFDSISYHVYYSDPKDSSYPSHYFSADSEDGKDIYIMLDDEGRIDSCDYHTDFDPNTSHADQVKAFNEVILEMDSAIQKSGVSAVYPQLLQCSAVPEDMSAQYLSSADGSDFYTSTTRNHLGYTFSSYVKDATEYSKPYLYFTVDSQ